MKKHKVKLPKDTSEIEKQRRKTTNSGNTNCRKPTRENILPEIEKKKPYRQ